MTAGEPIVLKNNNDRGWGKVLQRSHYIVIDNLQPGEYGINLGDPDKLNEKNNMKVTTFNVK